VTVCVPDWTRRCRRWGSSRAVRSTSTVSTRNSLTPAESRDLVTAPGDLFKRLGTMNTNPTSSQGRRYGPAVRHIVMRVVAGR